MRTINVFVFTYWEGKEHKVKASIPHIEELAIDVRYIEELAIDVRHIEELAI